MKGTMMLTEQQMEKLPKCTTCEFKLPAINFCMENESKCQFNGQNYCEECESPEVHNHVSTKVVKLIAVEEKKWADLRTRIEDINSSAIAKCEPF